MSELAVVAAGGPAEIAHFAKRRWPDEGGQRLYLHIAEQSIGGVWVARDNGEPIGIAFVHGTEEAQYLSECFVEPSYRGNGIGAALTTAALGDADARSLGALLDPLDFAAAALLSSRGIGIRGSVLRVAGRIPKEEVLASIAYGAHRFRAIPVDLERDRYALANLDREVRGFDRDADHALFASSATGHMILLENEPVGYAYVWPDGRVGPIAVGSGSYAPQIFAFGLMALASNYGATWCSAGIPGANVRVLRAALGIGLKIDMVRAFASGFADADLSRYVGYHPLLF